MKWLKKIAAAILMILAVLGLLTCLAGFAGALLVNAPLTNTTVVILDTADGYLSAMDRTVQRIQSGCDDLQEKVAEIQTLLIDSTVSDGAILAAAIDRIAGDELVQFITRLIRTVATLGERAQALNTTLVTLNQIPGVNLPTITEELETANNRLEIFREDLETMLTTLSTSQVTKNQLLTPVNRLAERLDQTEAALAEGKSKIEGVRASMSSLRVLVPRLFDLASLVLATIFILFGAGQVLLFERALKWFKSVSLAQTFETPGTGGEEPSGLNEEISPEKKRFERIAKDMLGYIIIGCLEERCDEQV